MKIKMKMNTKIKKKGRRTRMPRKKKKKNATMLKCKLSEEKLSINSPAHVQCSYICPSIQHTSYMNPTLRYPTLPLNSPCLPFPSLPSHYTPSVHNTITPPPPPLPHPRTRSIKSMHIIISSPPFPSLLLPLATPSPPSLPSPSKSSLPTSSN